MDTTEEEHEQAVVTSSSSPSSIVDILDSKSIDSEKNNNNIELSLLEYLEKTENERILTAELEQILIQIAKTGYSR